MSLLYRLYSIITSYCIYKIDLEASKKETNPKKLTRSYEIVQLGVSLRCTVHEIEDKYE